MKSKPYGFGEIKSVFLSAKGDFICVADFIRGVDLSRRQTDLDEKSTNLVSRLMLFSGGEGWIRTTEAISSRFTVCPLWPLGNLPILSFSKKWSW